MIAARGAPASWPAASVRCWSSTSTWSRWPASPPTPASTSGSPRTSRSGPLAYLVVVLENHHQDRLEEDTQALAELIARLGALDVYVLPDQAGAQLIAARERAFWASKANGADDIVDVVVPRASIPAFLTAVGRLADRHLLIGHRVWPRRRRQCPPVGVAGRSRASAAPLLHDIIALRGRPRRGRLGRARDRASEEAVPGRARGPGQARPHAPDQGRLRSPRHPQPGHHLRSGAVDGSRPVNGAQALIRTLVAHGVDTCFMNPGTSEMHFVAALDDVPAMRSVLALFEGVATGAADGYARMAGRPAATLLHLGPGLGNGLANLHNARRAHSPVVNIVGDHAISHRPYDAQLQSDIETVARNVSTFVRTSESTAGLSGDAARRPGRRHRPSWLGGDLDPSRRRVVVRAVSDVDRRRCRHRPRSERETGPTRGGHHRGRRRVAVLVSRRPSSSGAGPARERPSAGGRT